MLRQITATIPPYIARLDYVPPMNILTEAADAQAAVARLDAGAGGEFAPLAQLLTRTEAVSSSRIEGVEASLDDYARAVAGSKANQNATSMVAAGAALTRLIDSAGNRGSLDLGDILAAHEVLMRDDPIDAPFAGKLRTVQNWIGGSDYSPRGAVHIPPTPERVEPLMADLIAFSNRDDIPALPQAAIAHAQFESIHPFTDGNGRIGRALINAILRRRGVTDRVVLPIASAMVADRARYFRLVNDYRTGAVDPFVRHLSRASRVAAEESAITDIRLRDIPAEWAALARTRAGSAAAALLALLPEHPILPTSTAARLTGAVPSSLYAALDKLEADGVIHEVTGRKRDRVYAASAIADELTWLERRIGERMTER